MILDKINTNEDLKNINISDLNELANEMREIIIKKVNATGGHMAPNLGVFQSALYGTIGLALGNGLALIV